MTVFSGLDAVEALLSESLDAAVRRARFASYSPDVQRPGHGCWILNQHQHPQTPLLFSHRYGPPRVYAGGQQRR